MATYLRRQAHHLAIHPKLMRQLRLGEPKLYIFGWLYGTSEPHYKGWQQGGLPHYSVLSTELSGVGLATDGAKADVTGVVLQLRT